MLAIIIFGISLVIICIISSISMKKLFDFIERKKRKDFQEAWNTLKKFNEGKFDEDK